MADWIGSARTNYFRISDKEGLIESLTPFPLSLQKHSSEEDYYCILSNDEYGGWPSAAYIDNPENEEDDEIEFSFKDRVMPYVKEGEVVIAMECGAEKLRYLTGHSSAFVREGDEIKECSISMSDIYQKASEVFEIDQKQIARCAYQEIPEAPLSKSSRFNPRP